ncbi:MAG: hypothetical protein ISP41_16830 [Alphaproteobacteria bacterium]|nr:hypothetical protein [Alphaproteobacteria bacterium]
MKLGFVGLGKLGLPCAVAADMKGHDVLGYDTNPKTMSKAPRRYKETGPDGVASFDPYLEASAIGFGSLEDVVDHGDIIFVAVQTPHDARYEGITRLPDERVDFDYSHLVRAIEQISRVVKKQTIVSIVSTVLPGTIRRLILSVASPRLRICYTPSFIAMGTTMRDYLNPEFVLLGVHHEDAALTVEAYYKSMVDAPIVRTTLETAELIKIAYNTFITMKVVFANTMMEIAHHVEGADVDEMTRALGLAHRRLMSPAYLKGGMGDGGGCHPRDNIAMSWLARNVGLSFDLFDSLMTGRERQCEWLADLMCASDLPKWILGYSFKADSNITTGSAAVLLKNLMEERGYEVGLHDPIVDGPDASFDPAGPVVALIGSAHKTFAKIALPAGSVLIDPWRIYNGDTGDIEYVPLGARGTP